MCEVLVLPNRIQSSEANARLTEELATAFAQGQNLGSRAQHIQAGGVRLLELVQELQEAVDCLEGMLGIVDMQDRMEIVRNMLVSVRDLSNAALAYPSTDGIET